MPLPLATAGCKSNYTSKGLKTNADPTPKPEFRKPPMNPVNASFKIEIAVI